MLKFDSLFSSNGVKREIGVEPAAAGTPYRSQPGALFISTYRSQSPKVRMSSILKPLDTSTTKRVRIQSPTSTASSSNSKRAPSGRIRLVPLKNPTSVLKTSESKREYLDYLKNEIERKKTEKKLEDKRLKSPVVGLVPIMDQSWGGRPRRNRLTGELLDQKLPSTDVTSNFTRTRELNAKRFAYYEELEKQANDRKYEEDKRRERERNEANKHYEAWATLWGRPGNGAPLNSNGNHKKENLWRLLLDAKLSEKS